MPNSTEPVALEKNPTFKTKLKIIPGDTRLLIIAPHGRNTKPMDDKMTDKVVFKIQERLKCCAIVNDTVPKKELNYRSFSEASKDTAFIKTIEDVAKAEGPSLVVWIHGALNANVDAEAINPGSKFKGKPEKLHALIGYGQGKNPKPQKGTEKAEDKESRFTAEKDTVEKFRDLLTDKGMKTILTRDDALNFRGRDLDNMNQYFLNKLHKFSQVQSVQIEIRERGFREEGHIEKTATIIADALSKLVNLPLKALEVIEAPAENLPVAVIDPDEELVNKAYEYLKETFRKHFHNAMVEAGNYIIETFYENDPLLAFAKNKAKDQKPPLIKLIKKLAGASQDPMETAPSVTWFYNAVNLAAHEAICKEKRLQTFAILGHSHKLELLHVPKLKTVQGKNFDEVIGPAFKEKERLAVVARDKKFSVRAFKSYIKTDRLEKEQTGELKGRTTPGLNLENMPSLSELRNLDVRILTSGEQQAKEMVEFHKKKAELYQHAQKKIATVLEDTEALTSENASPEKRITGFRDWTKPGNIVNICFGCSNDCIYCFNRAPAYRRGWIEKGHWKDEVLRPKEIDAKRKLFNGRVAFPTTHDITPKNLDAYLMVLGKLLKAGNEILIVSKPRLECIKRVCEASAFFKAEILFRFTIGATDDKILKIFEPNAPRYKERKACLEYAFKQGYKTSVSVEPMLDSPNIKALVDDLIPFVNDAIWIGTLNHSGDFSKDADDNLLKAIQTVEANQTKEKIQPIYDRYKDNPKIKWKDKIKKMMGLEAPPAAGMDL